MENKDMNTPETTPAPMPAAPAAPATETPAFSQPAPPAEVKYNTLAIVGFVLSFFTNLIGAIISLVSLSQIKKTGEKGRGLAIAGAIIGFVGLIGWILYFIIVAAFVGAAVSEIASQADSSSYSSLQADSNDDPFCAAANNFVALSSNFEALNDVDEVKKSLTELSEASSPTIAAGIQSALAALEAEDSEKFVTELGAVTTEISEEYITKCF